MKIGLFIPCYIDQFYPRVGIATHQLLVKLGCDVHYVREQTCCGQPLANSGYEDSSRSCANRFINNFSDFDFTVTPSGSCAYHVRHHYDFIQQTSDVVHVRNSTLELTEFIVDVLKKPLPKVTFPHKVGLHSGCHGLRGLRLAAASETKESAFNKVEELLNAVDGLELVYPERLDECCGFGGTFSVKEEKVSVAMGNDRIHGFLEKDVAYITSADMSCLMHLDGLIRRQGLLVQVVHVAEILNESVYGAS
ncbi:MAG: (Fe-S)-binding protein [Bacteroidetes bacterium]|nr:(Fe-S)-binding protein [Bacteroidota bacterium]